MKSIQFFSGSHRLLMTALFFGTLTHSVTVNAESESFNPGSRKVLPLAESASRGIVTRDPSDIVQCKNEYWVFYTGHGVPSYHSKDLVNWERGPAVFKAPPK